MGKSTANHESTGHLFGPASILAAGLVITAALWYGQEIAREQEYAALTRHLGETLQRQLQEQIADYTESLRQLDFQLGNEPRLDQAGFAHALDQLNLLRRRTGRQLAYAGLSGVAGGESRWQTTRSPGALQLQYLAEKNLPLPYSPTELQRQMESLQSQRRQYLLLAPAAGSGQVRLHFAKTYTRRRQLQQADDEPASCMLLLSIPLPLLVERIQPHLGDWTPALRISDLGLQQAQGAVVRPQLLYRSAELQGSGQRIAERSEIAEVLGRRWQIEYHYLGTPGWDRQRQQQNMLLLAGCGASFASAFGAYSLIRQRQRYRRHLAQQREDLHRQAQANNNWRQQVEDVDEALLTLDLNGVVSGCNPAAQRLLGFTRDELLGQTLHQLSICPSDEYPASLARIQRGLAGSSETQVRDRDGRAIPVRLRTFPQLAADGRLCGEIQELTDLRALADAGRQLHESRQQLLDFMLLSPDNYWETDVELRLRNTSASIVPGSVLDVRLLAGLRHWELPGFQGDAAQLQQEMAAHRPFDGLRYSIDADAGQRKWLEISAKPIFNIQGRFSGYRGIARDITQLVRIETAIRTEKERAQITLESIGDAVVTTDTEGRISYLNPAALRFTGWSQQEALGKPASFVLKLIDDHTHETQPDPIQQVLRERRSICSNGSTSLLRLDGQEFAVEQTAAPICDSHGVPQGAVLVLRDVTQSRKLAAQLSYQARHDELTGLPNRRAFEQHLQQLLQTPLNAAEHTLLFLDLDQFKIVNDTCGHVAGDQLLKQIAVLIRQQLRSNDICARLGGDEFGVLLDSCPQDVALRIADKLRTTVSDFRFAWENKLFHVGLSIGLVSFNPGGFDQIALLSAADTACYMAKEKGRNRVQVHHRDDVEVAFRQGEMQWLARINAALSENRFQLYFQLIAPNLHEEHGIHFEVLVRMVGEDGALIPPGAFIPAAERYNLMGAIDRWIIGHTFEFIDQFRHELPPIEACGLNLSGASMADPDLQQFIQQQLEQYRIPPEKICFEITETAAIANLAQAMQMIRELKQMGCKFALDDFGSGMSSFGYLKHLPVDYLKIDGSFVKNMTGDPIDAAMVAAINNIGHVMGLRTIAEFVENDAIRDALCALGVDYSQGYGIGKPLPAAALLEF